jgi:hypothetical protein
VPDLVDGEGSIEATFEAPPLQPGLYSVALSILGPDGIALYDSLGVAGDFVVPAASSSNGFVIDRGDLLHIPARFEHHEAGTHDSSQGNGTH